MKITTKSKIINVKPEQHMNNKSFATGKERFASVSPDEFLKIEPAIATQEQILLLPSAV